MSSVSDAFSGATSGVTDQTLSDASLGSDITGGGSLANTGSSLFGGTGDGSFNSFSDIANALSGGGSTSPNAAQALSMAPPAAAAATGGDPTGASGGTQSATSPGSQPAQTQGGGQPNQNQQQSQHAPESAVDQLRQLLKGLQGKPQGPTAQVPTPTPPQRPLALPSVTPGQTGAPSVQPGEGAGVNTVLQDALGAPSAGARTPPQPETTPDPAIGVPMKGAMGPPLPPQPPEGTPQTDAQGNPVTAAGTPAAQTPLPPSRPTDDQTASTTGGKPTPKTDDQGRQITVHKPGAGAADLPTRVPHPDQTKLPTHKGGPEPAPTPYPATTQIQRDIAGVSTGSPTALADLAQAAMTLAPLIGMFMGDGGRRGGHFRGGRFTHGVGPFRGFGGGRRAMGFHPGGSRPWPYHHPVHGWDMHHRHPGGGWLPMHPRHAAEFGYYPGMGAGQPDGSPDPTQDQNPNAPDPNQPPKETGADPGPASDTPSGAIPGVSGKQVDDYTRQVADKYGINPDIASKILGQESGYGQARRPGDDGTSFGPFQLHFAPDGHAMGDDFMRDTGKDPRDPSTWKAQIDYALKRASQGGWGPWSTTMKKLGLNQWSGITTNRQFAGKPMSTTQPQHLAPAAAIPTTLPPSSTGMVAG